MPPDDANNSRNSWRIFFSPPFFPFFFSFFFFLFLFIAGRVYLGICSSLARSLPNIRRPVQGDPKAAWNLAFSLLFSPAKFPSSFFFPFPSQTQKTEQSARARRLPRGTRTNEGPEREREACEAEEIIQGEGEEEREKERKTKLGPS